MKKEPWIPVGFELPNGTTLASQIYAGECWQIYKTKNSKRVLICNSELRDRWLSEGLLDDGVFEEITFENSKYFFLVSSRGKLLSPVNSGEAPESKVDGLAFSLAYRETKRLIPEVNFSGAIYLEQYSRLLPVWESMEQVDDKIILGTWLTGGVNISTDSYRRLSKLVGWLPSSELAEIVSKAGFEVPADANMLSKSKPLEPTSKTESKELDLHQESESQGLINKADRTFSLPGRPYLEAFFNDHIIDILFNSDRYSALGIEFPSAVILHGPPGCGKTFAVDKLAEFIDWPRFSIDSSTVGSPYIHETSKKISEVFDQAIDASPSILVIDEMESFLTDRRSGSSSGLHHVEEVAEFLRRIPEAISRKVLIIAMTNMIDTIDPAILRRGRFDHIIEVSMPSLEEVTSLLAALLSKIPHEGNLDTTKLAKDLEGKPLSDVSFVVREAARLAAKDGGSSINQSCVDRAFSSLPKAEKKRRIGFIQD